MGTVPRILPGLCYVLSDMRPFRTPTMKLALLLALIMPLQGFASAWSCGSRDAAPATAPVDATAEATAAAPKQCEHGGAAQQHHHCGTCCCAAAMAVSPKLWIAPRPANPSALLALRLSPPAIILDRLDRPPRLV
jgi:hypothetical protein